MAVYAVPDSRDRRPGDGGARDSPGRAGSIPQGFAAFLAEQPDLGTKWAPRYVRIVDALPVTGTDKVDKKPLRAQRWATDDPIWHRTPRSTAYVPFTDEDLATLRQEFEENGRQALFDA